MKRFIQILKQTNNYIYILICIQLPILSGCFYFEDSDRKPNIVLIVADDLGYDDVSCYNPNSGIPTPNIDNLAKLGLRFTDAHSSASSDLASRYAILTGRYGFRLDMIKKDHMGYGPLLIDLQRLTLPKLLQRAGYMTYMSGKWNMGIRWNLKGANKDSLNLTVPILTGLNEYGFDRIFYTCGSSIMDPPFFFISDDQIYNLPQEYSSYIIEDHITENTWVSPEWIESGVDTALLGKAQNYIDAHCNNMPDQPFFLYFAPHAPRLPSPVPDFAKDKSEMELRGDLCWLFDWMTGRLVESLKKNGIFEETLIIITSDNGSLHDSNRKNLNVESVKSSVSVKGQKGDIYEGGHRVPFIIVWPKYIVGGQVSEEIICQTDIMATLCAITGQKMTYYDAADSYSLSKILFGDDYDKPLRKATIHHAPPGMLALRAGKWKVVFSDQEYTNNDVNLSGEAGMVFNLDEDKFEENNLWYERQDVVKKYQIILDQYVIADRSSPILDGTETKEILPLDIPE